MTIKNNFIIIVAQANESLKNWDHRTNEIYIFYDEFRYLDEKRTVIEHLTNKENSVLSMNWLPNIEENEIFSDFSQDNFFVIWTKSSIASHYVKFRKRTFKYSL